MLDKKKKQALIKKFRLHEKDSGSAEIQIAILTEEIKELSKHLQSHKKDFSSRRGLLKKIGQRRRLLNFLRKDNPESYEKLVDQLKIKRTEKLIKEELVKDEKNKDEEDESEGEEKKQEITNED